MGVHKGSKHKEWLGLVRHGADVLQNALIAALVAALAVHEAGVVVAAALGVAPALFQRLIGTSILREEKERFFQPTFIKRGWWTYKVRK